MTLHVRVSRVDDYSGELTQGLAKLEAEQSRGVLNRDEQEDFLADLRKAVATRVLQPMRNRALADLVLAAVTALAAAFLPSFLRYYHPIVLTLLGLCVLGLGLAFRRFTLYLRRRRHEQDWLQRLDTAVAAGGTIFDAKA